MTSMLKPVPKKSVFKATTKHPSKMVATTKPTGQLTADKPKAKKVQDVPTLDNVHSKFNADRSEHYHAQVIGQPKPFNNSGLPTTKNRDKKAKERIATGKAQEKMQSTRPGRTAQRGLGG